MSDLESSKLPTHVAIIMDGNGRWARKRNLPRVEGHSKGIERAKEIVSTTLELKIPYLTLYAFSRENWQRPKEEIQALLGLLEGYLDREVEEMKERGIRLKVIGRISDFPDRIRRKLRKAMLYTSTNRDLLLSLALSYSGREEILTAVRRIIRKKSRGISIRVNEESFRDFLYTGGIPDPDLLIRTSGEMRISNFLLWQIAYTELYITETLWPDFGREEYLEALAEYRRRERRFGMICE
jgi:undecaprenyl diphosphate synthase